MTGAQHAMRPLVDEADPPWSVRAMLQQLRPAPGRLGDSLRITVLVLVCVTIWETFRIPEAALAAYIVLFVSRAEAGSTVMTALFVAASVVIAITVTIVVFAASLAEPGLRVPLIALTTFVAMLLGRVSPLGPLFFGAGFVIAYALTLGDQVLQLSLLPGSVSNNADIDLPELAFMPPEEALLHFLLWLVVVVGLPSLLVIAANLVTGRDPGRMLARAVADRLENAARFCDAAGQATAPLPAADSLASLTALVRSSTVLRRQPPLVTAALLQALDRILILVSVVARTPMDATATAGLERIGQRLARPAQRLRAEPPPPGTGLDAAAAKRPRPESGRPEPAVADPILAELDRQAMAVEAALEAPGAAAAPRVHHALFVADAWTNPEHARFALKVTLCVMLCYLTVDLTDWSGIHTAIITCYFVSLTTLAESVHKASLRLVGCLIGGGLGLGTILLLMPLMTDLGDLLLVVGLVTFAGAWIAAGSQRIAYAGLQIALAFYLTILQGFGPTLDMQTARDRLVGIVLGNLVVFAVFTTIWPRRLADTVRTRLAEAVEQLAQAIDPDSERERLAACRQHFAAAITAAAGSVIYDRFEPSADRLGRHAIDGHVLVKVEALLVPVAAVRELDLDTAWPLRPQATREAARTHQRALAHWFTQAADWVRTGRNGSTIAGALPAPPALPSPETLSAPDRALVMRSHWYRLLHEDLAAILAATAPPGDDHLVPLRDGAHALP